jgi:Predicted membrane protein (DUF2306)
LTKNLKLYKSILWISVFGYFFVLMLLITLKYIPFSTDASFLQIKQTEVSEIPFYLTFFYIHVYSAIFVLLAGFTQFNSSILKKYSKIHKQIGKLYVYIVLFFAAPSGLYIGVYANGGLFSQISFCALAILWFVFTLNGIIFVHKKEIEKHQQFMLRSFALAFSAITLRFWKVILVYLFQPSPMDLYQIIAWLGWIPNFLIIEFYIYKKYKS